MFRTYLLTCFIQFRHIEIDSSNLRRVFSFVSVSILLFGPRSLSFEILFEILLLPEKFYGKEGDIDMD